MANGEYEIDEATFKGMTVEQQNWILFKTYNSDREKDNKRFKTIENRKLADRGLSIGSGFVGGFIAVLLKKVF